MERRTDYYVGETAEGIAAFAADWAAVEARLRKILPLMDTNGKVVKPDTWVVNVDFSNAADALKGAPDDTGMVARFLNEVKKKGPRMTVHDLLCRPVGELTRWRKMGNRITLLPNALILHLKELK